MTTDGTIFKAIRELSQPDVGSSNLLGPTYYFLKTTNFKKGIFFLTLTLP